MKHIKLILSIWSTFIIYILGGFDVALKCLLILIVVDYFTGVSKAYYNNKLSRLGIKTSNIIEKLFEKGINVIFKELNKVVSD